MSDMRSFIKVEHSRFTLILRKGILPFHWIAESHVYPDKGLCHGGAGAHQLRRCMGIEQ